MRIFFYILLLHIIDDFCLQSHSLCNLKQKEFWEKNYPDEMYETDYITALIMHGFSWSIMIHLPIFAFSSKPDYLIGFSILINAIIHSLVDNLKANKKKINLNTDQAIHLFQLIVIYVLFIVF